MPWTEEARQRLERAPAFVRPGIVKLMARRARERGRAVIDSAFLTEIRNESMLLVARCIRGFGFEELSLDAFEVAKAKMRKLPRKVEVIEEIQRFLAARTEKNAMVLAKFQHYLKTIPARGLPWTEEALARLQRVPAPLGQMVRQAIEAAAREARERLVTGDVVDRCLASFQGADRQFERGLCPRDLVRRLASDAGAPAPGRPAARTAPLGEASEGAAEAPSDVPTMLWTAEAEERLRRIPLRPIREMVVRRTEAWARAHGLEVVDAAAYEAARAVER